MWFENEKIFLATKEGKVGSLPLKDFPLLYHATDKQRNNYELSPFGIHWPDIDEDLSFDGFFQKETEVSNPIATVLKKFPEINVSQLAARMGINQSLLAKYVCGNKNPSKEKIKQVEAELHRLGNELAEVKL